MREGCKPRIDTLYLGGGTPSLLNPQEIRALMDACKKFFEISDEPEITIEINPGTIHRSDLCELRKMGVNRASLGIQSLLDSELAVMGRSHNSAQAVTAFRDLRLAGFENVSVDLIAGYPGQTLDSVRCSLRSVFDLRPEHLSFYLLEVKKGTKLAEMIDSGELPPPDEDLMADMYDAICEMTLKAGYEHYEISNFALPGRFSRHNMKYWSDKSYIGFGPGAHGMIHRQRYANLESLDAYEQSLAGDVLPLGTVNAMPPDTRFRDALIMGLRLVKGVDLDAMGLRYGVDARAFVLHTIGDLQSVGLTETRENVLALTPRGRLLSNVVFSRWV